MVVRCLQNFPIMDVDIGFKNPIFQISRCLFFFNGNHRINGLVATQVKPPKP